jgi:hypothetical protein
VAMIRRSPIHTRRKTPTVGITVNMPDDHPILAYVAAERARSPYPLSRNAVLLALLTDGIKYRETFEQKEEET